MLQGYFSAIVTPFDGYNIDFNALSKYLNYIIDSKVSGFVVCGSTGESLSLSFDEKVSLIRYASKINKKKIPIYAGIIENSTSVALNLIKETENYVDGFLCICPYYIKPTSLQIFEHLSTLSKATKKDIIIYNNPGRTGVSINFETLQKLVDNFQNIVAIKECDSLSRFLLWRLKIRKDFSFLTGNDDLSPAALACGAMGVISVTSNIAPSFCTQLFDAYKRGDIKSFSLIRDKLSYLHKLLFSEPSPAPLKYALSRLNLIKSDLRTPLGEISLDLKDKIDDYLKFLEII